MDSPEHRKITLSWREDPVPSLTDVSMMSVDASCGNDDDSSESKTDVVSTTNAMDLKFRVSELEDEYQSLLDAKSDAEKSLAEERQRHQDVLDRKEALGRMHFNATVLRAKLEMSKLLGNGLCCQSLNVSVAQLYDEAKAQGVDPEAYSTWVRARLLDKK